MSSEFKDLTLGEVSQNISRRFDFKDKPEVVFINTGDVLEGKFLVSEYSKSEGLPGQAKKAIMPNDILFTEIRPANKRFAFIDFNSEDYVVSTKFMIIKANELINPRYLYLILTSNEVLRELQHVAESRSGTFPQITFDSVSYLPIKVPSLQTQKKIAHILSTLDDKIELNRKMNQTLEEMAQAIFKSWFVDFDPVHAKAKCSSEADYELAAKELGISKEVLDLFPSEFEDSELGMIPKGWSVEAMQNLISVKDGTHDSPKAKDEGYPLVTSKHIKNGVIDLDTANLISEEDYNKVNQRSKVEQYDILIGMIGTIGDLYYVFEEDISYAIKNIGLFKTSEVKDLSVFMYFWLDTNLMRNYIISRLAGTTQKYISLTELRKLPVLIPSQQLLDKYRNLASNMLEAIVSNNKEIQTLQKTRDTLLPKLLSGELDVSELEMDI